MKNTRQKEILSIIETYTVETQEELTARLHQKGFSCTQATVSRDIKELRLSKVPDEKGGYKYAQPAGEEKRPEAKYDSILQETVLSVDAAGNLVVIKTFNGMAMAACAAIDAMKWEDVLGSIAGDDTIFMVLRTPEFADRIRQRLDRILRQRVE